MRRLKSWDQINEFFNGFVAVNNRSNLLFHSTNAATPALPLEESWRGCGETPRQAGAPGS
jgi:hypothetical protein